MGLESKGMLRTARSWLVLTLTVVAGQAPALETEVPRPLDPGDFELNTVTGQTPDGVPVTYELGTLFVPENRTVPGSRLIRIGFARFRAEPPTQGPPVFVLPGGPGFSTLETFTGNDAASRQRLAMWSQFSAAGDVVVMDQRGYSKRGEVLEFTLPPQPLDRPRSLASDADALVKAAGKAVTAHPGKDLAGYTLTQLAEDVNTLRQTLGYKQVSLYGGSFGSQWGLAVMRLHPEIVARALLSDVEPLDNGYDMPSQVFATLQRIAWDADKAPGLATYLPTGGVMGALREVRDRLAKGPIKVKVQDEKTGRTHTVTLGLEDFQDSLIRPAQAWPAFILSLYHRHYDDWAQEVLQQRLHPEPNALIGPLIDTSLGVSPAREHQLRTDPGTDFLGAGGFHSYIASASAWPTPDLGDAMRLPVSSPIPVLFLHGTWDTSTPIENVLGLLPYFPNSRTVLVHRGTHGDRKTLRDQHRELWWELITFLKTGGTQHLPATVTLTAPAFQVPSFPAPAAARTGR